MSRINLDDARNSVKSLAGLVRRPMVICIVLAMLMCTIQITSDPTSASIFVDLGSPDATFKDVMWDDNSEYAMVVGNDSSNNGVVYRYTEHNETWDQTVGVPGDKYNAVTRTEAYVYYDSAEGGMGGWTGETLSGKGAEESLNSGPSDTLTSEPESSLIAHWKFDEGLGTTVKDISGNRHHGTTNANWVDGMSAGALEFSLAEETIVPNVVDLTSGGSFTGDCWINKSSHESFGGIVNKYGSGGWGIWDQTDGGIRYYLHDGATTSWNDATPISNNEWHHIAWSYNVSSGLASFYIDGNLDYSMASVNPLRTITPIEIGSRGGTNYLNGMIDEVRIHDRALSLKEISDYYNITYNKVLELRMDEGAGITAVDSSQHDNNGTLTNMEPGDWVNGISGTALDFDGVDELVNCGNDPSLEVTNGLTLEAWFKPKADGWKFKKALTISGSASPLINHQVRIDLDAGNFDFAKAGPNGEDIRFYDDTGTKLDYWIADWSAGSATVWVEVPSIPTSGTTVYMYYGNLGAVSESDHTTVLEPYTLACDIASSASHFGEVNTMYLGSPVNTPADKAFSIVTQTGMSFSTATLPIDLEFQIWDGVSDPSTLEYTFPPQTVSAFGWFYSPAVIQEVDISSGLWVVIHKLAGGSATGVDCTSTIASNLGRFSGDSSSWNGWGGNPPSVYFNGYTRDLATPEPTSTVGDENAVGINKLDAYGIGVDTSSAYASINGVVINSAITPGWNHVVLTYDSALGSDHMKLYVNGTLAGQTDCAGGISTNGNDLIIGDKIAFNGTIDEVSIWNYSLSAGEIFESYNTTLNNYYSQSIGGEWHFEEGSGDTVLDSTLNENDGTLMPDFAGGNAPTRVAGITGDALHFDNFDDYVEVPHSPSLDITENITIEAYINPGNVTGYGGIAAKRLDGSTIQYYFRTDNNVLSFYYYSAGSPHVYGTGVVLTAGEWQHVAMTYTSGIGSSMKIYVNGVEKAGAWSTGNGNNPLVSNAANVWIGACQSGDYFFDGDLDRVKIHNRILNGTEIFDSYNITAAEESTPNLNWQVTDPSGLPVPGSGVSHGIANSPSNAWWFGNSSTGNYDIGERVNGSLISPPVYLPSSSTFGAAIFSHWFDVEDVGPGKDIMNVSVKNTTDSGWTELRSWDSESTPITSWYQEIIDISGWLGNFVQIKFTFDSVDGNLNDYAGWHIDDFVLYANDVYVVVGEIPTGGGYSAYSTSMGGGLKDIGGMNSIAFNDVAGGSVPATFVAVGDSAQARYWNGSAWISITGMNAGDTLTGVDFNGTHFFMVGYDISNNGVAYYITEANLVGAGTVVTAIPGGPSARLNSINWHNNINGGMVCAEGGTYILTSTWIWMGPIGGADASMNFTAASWNIQGSRVIMVGNTGTGSAAYELYVGNSYITRIPDYDNIFQSHKLYGAAYQPRANGNVDILLVGASAFKVSAKSLDQKTAIIVNAESPHMFDVDFFETSNPGTSLVNKQVNVGDTYTFYTEVNYTAAGVDKLFDGINNTAIDFIAWYDENGVNETKPLTMDDNNRTRLLNVTWFEGDGVGVPENAIITYPTASPGTDEFQLMGFNSGSLGGDHWWIEVEVYFGFQTRAADGGGFGGGASGNEDNVALSFNDANSWNFMVNIYDITFTGAHNTSYEEFGLFRFTNITATGNPSGNAPPGSNNNLLGSSMVTCSANVDYYMNISIPNLARQGGGGTIDATYIAIRSTSTLANDTNSMIASSWPFGRPFDGANVNLTAWGNTSQPFADWVVAVPQNGTTAHGPWGSDFNGYGATTIDWYASVPGGTLEGIYQATITFKIGYY
ncbi:MAG: DUF2341 domain-containing protein [Thermoplasmata archaeon]|nr:DUF2341 domain-containing protein [Thermoplasmata archaeon]